MTDENSNLADDAIFEAITAHDEQMVNLTATGTKSQVASGNITWKRTMNTRRESVVGVPYLDNFSQAAHDNFQVTEEAMALELYGSTSPYLLRRIRLDVIPGINAIKVEQATGDNGHTMMAPKATVYWVDDDGFIRRGDRRTHTKTVLAEKTEKARKKVVEVVGKQSKQAQYALNRATKDDPANAAEYRDDVNQDFAQKALEAVQSRLEYSIEH